MNIQTVRKNLERTIANKEAFFAELQTNKANDEVSQVVAQFMQINLDELKRILADVEQCCQTQTKKKADDSWVGTVDHQSGAFTDEEVERCRNGGW